MHFGRLMFSVRPVTGSCGTGSCTARPCFRLVAEEGAEHAQDILVAAFGLGIALPLHPLDEDLVGIRLNLKQSDNLVEVFLKGHCHGAALLRGPVPPRVLEARTAFFAPVVAAIVRQGTPNACQQISFAVDYAEHGAIDPYTHTESRSSGRTELLIIDEADPLKTTGLEQVRDHGSRPTRGKPGEYCTELRVLHGQPDRHILGSIKRWRRYVLAG